jgi:hypothetical protein
MYDKIIIRRANASDAEALERLAQLDSSRVPEGELIVASIGGELRAAMPESGGTGIADPFHYTEEILEAMTASTGADMARPRVRRRGLLTALRLA